MHVSVAFRTFRTEHVIGLPSPLTISRTFLLEKTLCLLNYDSPCLPPYSWEPLSLLWPDYSRYLIERIVYLAFWVLLTCLALLFSYLSPSLCTVLGIKLWGIMHAREVLNQWTIPQPCQKHPSCSKYQFHFFFKKKSIQIYFIKLF